MGVLLVLSSWKYWLLLSSKYFLPLLLGFQSLQRCFFWYLVLDIILLDLIFGSIPATHFFCAPPPPQQLILWLWKNKIPSVMMSMLLFSNYLLDLQLISSNILTSTIFITFQDSKSSFQFCFLILRVSLSSFLSLYFIHCNYHTT